MKGIKCLVQQNLNEVSLLSCHSFHGLQFLSRHHARELTGKRFPLSEEVTIAKVSLGKRHPKFLVDEALFFL